ARRAIDMVQLVSRPIPSRPFDYRFDCVLGGHPLDDEVAAALAEMQAEKARVRVFGSYRAERDEGGETVAAWPSAPTPPRQPSRPPGGSAATRPARGGAQG